jgi:hypothetical protein
MVEFVEQSLWVSPKHPIYHIVVAVQMKRFFFLLETT